MKIKPPEIFLKESSPKINLREKNQQGAFEKLSLHKIFKKMLDVFFEVTILTFSMVRFWLWITGN